ncbi:MAG: undecaprenyl-phosphate galactose phosphotransferase WbaP [Rhodocyclales bacterium]|nr:undecaprenyl-phosphate galactose phosphotransferase WbaP [Rhodocyclales bacterium]
MLSAFADMATLWLAFLIGRLVMWSYHEPAATYGSGSFADIVAWWPFGTGPIRVAIFLGLAVGMTLWFWGVLGHYARRRPYWDEVREILVVVGFSFMLDAMIVFLGKWQFSRLALGSTWVAVLVLLPITRLATHRWINRRGWQRQPYVIIGSSQEALETIAAIGSEPLMGFEPVAVLTRPGTTPDASLSTGAGAILPVLPIDDDIETYLRKPGPLRIVVVLDNGGSSEHRALIQSLCFERDDVYIVPAMSGLPLQGMEITHFFSHEVLFLRARNNLNRRAARWIKRTFDVLGAATALIVLLPLLLAVSIQIWLQNGRPMLYSQLRVGYDGRLFRFYKFRSMVSNADKVLEKWKLDHPARYRQYCANNFKLEDDPRVTRVGNWIRRTSIDELPQLWNVLRGDMSLVGPRPLLPRELGEYGESIHIYNHVRPGITGLWQISGRSSTTFDQRIALDRWYIRNWSLWYDLVILIRTVRVVLRSEGAY